MNFEVKPAGRRAAAIWLGSCLLAWLCPLASAYGQTNAQETTPLADASIIVRYRTEATSEQRRSLRMAAGASDVTLLPLIHGEILNHTQGDPRTAAALLAREPGVEYAEPNYLWQADRVPNDPQFPLQWGLHNTGQVMAGSPDADIDAPEAWDLSTGRPILIGIIDSGIDSAHEDLAANLWLNPGEIPGNQQDDDGNGYVDDLHGWDFVDGDNAPYDLHGHGTHVSGIAAAVGNNGIGVTGVDWSARLVPLRFLNADGLGANSSAILAISYAVRAGIRITCNSWGGAPYSLALRDAIAAACDSGMLFVAAAGNNRKNTDVSPHYPASYDIDGIVSVAATDMYDRLVNWPLWGSNYGAKTVDLGAPGAEVLSCWPHSQYVTLSGTSMAAPHVAGAAAVLWSEHPQLSAGQVKARLMNTSDPLPDLALTTRSGGRLNLRSALAGPDSLAPRAIVDLQASRVEGTRVELSFTASGDDALEGSAARYVIRYGTQPLEQSPPDSVVEMQATVTPSPAGTQELLQVTHLRYGTRYYFDVRAEDEWFNRSGSSNLLTVVTLGPPALRVDSARLDLTVSAGARTSVLRTIANAGPGEMFFTTNVEYAFDRARGALPAALPDDTLDVLLVYADQGALGLDAILEGFADLGRVDVWFAGVAGGRIPRYRDLRSYDVVVAWNNRIWEDPYEIGAVLADFVDSGGAVVTLVDSWGSGSFASLGRYFDDPGYSPFISTGDALFEVRTLGDFNRDHPIMKDVDYLAIGSYHNQVRLSPLAHLVARWNDGTPLVATCPHTVAINIWPGDGYHWLGDFPTLIHNAIKFAAGADSWLETTPVTGEIGPGDSLQVSLTVDARKLFEGTHEAFVKLSTTDPALPEVEFGVALNVVGVPRLTYQPLSVEFEDAFTGYAVTDSIQLHNVGTAPLWIRHPSFDVPAFTTTFDSVVILPQAGASLPISFQPPTVGEFWSNLSFATNDPDRPVVTIVLHSVAALPPVARLTRELSPVSLFSGDTRVDTVHLVNGGEGELQFRTVLRGSGPAVSRSPRPGSSGVPEGAADSNVVSGQADSVAALAWVRYADLSPGNEFEGVQRAFADAHAPVRLDTTSTFDPAELEKLLYDRELFLVAEQENALPDLRSIGNAFAPVLREFVNRGGTVVFLMEWGGGAGFATSTGLLDITPVARSTAVSLKVPARGHPLLEGVSDTLVGTSLTAWYQVHTPGAEVLVTDTSGRYAVVAEAALGAGRSILLGFDYFTYNDNLARLLANCVFLARQNLAWLEVTPASGVVPPGDSTALTVRFDAEGQAGGTLDAELNVETNDPVNPRHRLTAHLSVMDAPHLHAPALLDFGLVYMQSSVESLLVLKNTGTLPLIVDSLGTPGAGFLWTTAGFTLTPHAEESLLVRLSPEAPGQLESWLRLYSNDPSEPMDSIRLAADLQAAPRLVVAADTLAAALPAGGRGQVTLNVHNGGGSALEFRVVPSYLHADDPQEDTAWQPFAALPEARNEAGVVALADGKVYVFGGYGEGSTALPSLVVFDPQSGNWSQKAPMPTSDHGMATATDRQGRVYSFSSSSPPSYRYDPVTNLWERIADMPKSMVWEARAALGPDGLIYVVGGEGTGPDDPLGTVQVFHPDDDYWTVASDMPTPRYGHALVSDPAGRLYAIGGRQSFQGDPIASVEVYDFFTRRWQTLTDRPMAASQFGATLGCDSRIYTMGGKTSYLRRTEPFFDQVFIYDPRADRWSEGPRLPLPLGEGQAVTTGNFIRYIGGADTLLHAEPWVLYTPRWLGGSSSRRALAPGQSLDLTLALDATGLDDTSYQANLLLLSNDPLTPAQRVAFDLNVQPSPDLLLVTDSLRFPPVYVGEQDTLGLSLANRGTSDLHVDVHSTTPDLFRVGTGITIAPGGDSLLKVVWAPEAAGIFGATLEITCNDPDLSSRRVGLSGWGLLPGVASVTPDSVALSVTSGQDSGFTLRVANTGAGVLNWKLSGAELSVTDPGVRLDREGTRSLVPTPAVTPDSRRLSGLTIAISDSYYFSSHYALIKGDLELRGAHVRDFDRPFGAALLDSIDVLVIDRVVAAYFDADLTLLRNWVARGGRLLLENNGNSGVPQENKLLQETGISVFGQNSVTGIFTQMGDHSVGVSIDSIMLGPSTLFMQWQEPALPLVLDDHGRGMVVASQWGQGRMVAACSDLLFDDYVRLADTRRFANRLLDWLAVGTPLVADRVAGSVPAGGSIDVHVQTSTTAITGGEYHEQLELHTQEPQADRLTVPVSLFVTGVPGISLASDTLQFDSSFVGYGNTRALVIRNLGSSTLTITRIHAEPASFTAPAGGYTIPVFDSVAVTIACVPPEAGDVNGVLTIESDAQGTPVRTLVLHGTGLLPPAIQSPLDPIDFTLNSGETGRRLLRIANAGVSELKLRVDVLSVESPGGQRGRVPVHRPAGSAMDSVRATASRPADKAGRAAAASSTPLYQGEFVSFGVTDAGDVYPFRYPGDTEQVWTSGYTVVYRADGSDQLFSTYQFPEALVHDSLVEDVADSQHVSVRFVGHTHDGRVGIERTVSFERDRKYVAVDTRIVNRTAARLEGVAFKAFCDFDLDLSPQNDNWDYDTLRQMPYGWDQHYVGLAFREQPTVIDIEGRDDHRRRLTEISYPVGPVYFFDAMPILHIELGDLPPGGAQQVRTVFAIGDSLADMTREVDRGMQRVKWLDTDVRSNVVASSSHFDLGLDFSATELFAGDYFAKLLVSSNDPATPEMSWPVHLRVNGGPLLAMNRDTVNFGVVYLGYPVTRTIPLANTGTDVLHITDVSTGHVTLVSDWTGANLLPKHDTVLQLTLTPRDTGSIVGLLHLVHDDTLRGEVRIPIRARAAWPPAIDVASDTLRVTVGSGALARVPLRVFNAGPGVLQWSFPVHPYVAAAPSFGSLPPQTSVLITLVVSASGLPPGAAITSVVINHNDPARPPVMVPLALDVFAVRRGDAYTDNRVDVRDIIFMVNSVWKGGPDPVGLSGDLNCDDAVGPSDLLFLINYIFKGGPAPNCP